MFPCQKDLVLLCIETGKVKSEIRYEGTEKGEMYPHIYGPLNVDAVVKTLDFEPGKDGKFTLPRAIPKWETSL